MANLMDNKDHQFIRRRWRNHDGLTFGEAFAAVWFEVPPDAELPLSQAVPSRKEPLAYEPERLLCSVIDAIHIFTHNVSDNVGPSIYVGRIIENRITKQGEEFHA